jgi:hypothetical protein
MARADAASGPAATWPDRPRHPPPSTQRATAARVLAAALAYAAAGWPVFPCQAGAKAPLTVHGFKNASTAPAVIRAWWDRWPGANVAIATGAPGPDVLDVDVKPDGDGWPAFNRLSRAGLLGGARALVRTPSGGLHAYFAGTGQRNGKLARHHLDFRGAGGYVLAPPSRVHGQVYELLDHRSGATGQLDWQAVTRLLDPARPPARSRGSSVNNLAGLAAWVAAQREGNRNDGLYWAARRAAEAGQRDLGALVAAAVRAGLAEAEARRTVASAVKEASR